MKCSRRCGWSRREAEKTRSRRAPPREPAARPSALAPTRAPRHPAPSSSHRAAAMSASCTTRTPRTAARTADSRQTIRRTASGSSPTARARTDTLPAPASTPDLTAQKDDTDCARETGARTTTERADWSSTRGNTAARPSARGGRESTAPGFRRRAASSARRE